MKLTVRKRNIQTIPVLEVVPTNHAAESLPLVIFYHGWQTSKELLLTQARKIAQKSYRVLLPDAMFHGERNQWPISSIPSQTFWTSIQYNIVEFNVLIKYAKQHGWIDKQPIYVGGYSMGGITTAALLAQHPEITAGASIMGTPTPLTYFQHMQHRMQTELHRDFPPDLIHTLSWLAHYDLGRHPEKINGRPLLLWHGTLDPKIPYQEVAQFYAQVKDQPSAKNLTFLTGEGQGHLVTPTLMQTIADFIDAN